jgi:disulfide bond formation protein DsbB
MEAFTTFMNMLWAVLTVAANALSVCLIAAHVSPKFRQSPSARFFKDRGIQVAFIASFLATAGSLIYSDVIGYTPCELCWFQRIFMYPQAVIMLIALIKKDASVKIYGFVLSIIGAAIAVYHYFLQLGYNPLGLPCAAVGYSVSCAKNFVLEFGYITIPVMALSAFVLIALTLSLSFRKEN